MKLDGRTLYEAFAWEIKPEYTTPTWEKLDEPHQRAWEAVAKAADRPPPLAQQVPAEVWAKAAELSRQAFDQILKGYDEVASEVRHWHHRSCAIRRGGNECTC